MPDIRKTIANPDTSKPAEVDHRLDLEDWDQAEAARLAADQGIELTDGHWAVIYRLRAYYLEHGPPGDGRTVGDMLDKAFEDAGGRRYLRKLFPEGPVGQGMRIAGLPVPPHTEDEGFGTSR
jgi:tRNA 2-thiouridine synthesizing protein E